VHKKAPFGSGRGPGWGVCSYLGSGQLPPELWLFSVVFVAEHAVLQASVLQVAVLHELVLEQAFSTTASFVHELPQAPLDGAFAPANTTAAKAAVAAIVSSFFMGVSFLFAGIC
jgi:hypothetical protein